MSIYVYTGDGAGKTTASIGLALRNAGQERYSVIIQFLKWFDSGELKIQEKLKPYYKIYQFGRKNWHGIKNLNEEDKKLCKQAFNFAKDLTKEKNLDLLILDEINLAMNTNLLEISEVVSYLKTIPKSLDIVLTGRDAPKEIIEIADIVTEMKTKKFQRNFRVLRNVSINDISNIIKYPKEMINKKGITY